MEQTVDYSKHRLVRKSTQKVCVEVNCKSFSIGKVTFDFVTYETGKHLHFYMNFSELLMWADKVSNGALFKGTNNAHFGFKGYEKEGKVISRQMTAGMAEKDGKYFFNLTCVEKPGEKTANGGITPLKTGAEEKIFVSMTYDDIREIFMTAKAYVEAYLVYELKERLA